MTDRIRSFLDERRPAGPCLVVDLEIVRRNYEAFARVLPDSRIFYAVKANPAPEILNLLASLGSSFDAASVNEIEMVLETGAAADRISYGNTIKKERDIARAFELGVSLFAVDCAEEVEKVARAAPGARVFCRILTDGGRSAASSGAWRAKRSTCSRMRPSAGSSRMASPSMSARSRPT
jgi:ornithine decarboxylase